MTKNIANIALSLMVAFMAVACTDSDSTIGFSLGVYEKQPIELTAVGGKEIVLVETNESWVATTNVPWITISPANGIGTVACEVFVDSAIYNESRDAQIRFTPSVSPEKSIMVKQYGFEKIILPKDTVITIESSADKNERFFETEITSNVDFKVEFDYIDNPNEGDGETKTVQWLSCDKKQVAKGETARPHSVKLRFDWRMNTVPAERQAKIKFVPVDANDK
jgi:hypothetical protein